MARYKQIRNMDFNLYEVRNVIEHDQLLIFNKVDNYYYIMNIDSSETTEEEAYFNRCRSLLTKYDCQFAPRDDILMMPIDMSKSIA